MKTHNKRHGNQRALWVILTSVVGALLLLGAAAWFYVQDKLNRIKYSGDSDPLLNSQGEESALANLDDFQILLMGTDERAAAGAGTEFNSELRTNARSDCCMLFNLNFTNSTVSVVSLERAIGVPVTNAPGNLTMDWLTHVFTYGGATTMMKTVAQQFDVNVQRYVRVNITIAGNIVDAVGGVDITLSKEEADALNGITNRDTMTKAHVKAGVNHLDGHDAIAYARLRSVDSDFHRVQRQRNVIQAAIDQTKKLSLTQIDSLLNTVLPMLQTNLTKAEISALIGKAPQFIGVQMRQMTLPLKGTYYSKYNEEARSMMMLNMPETQSILHQFLFGDFNPDTYTVPQEVTNWVISSQRTADKQWAAAHPQVSATPATMTESAEESLLN